ncbi:MAG: ribbon-helix-helix protein, CopG family [Bryobacterales bacterium]|nr:ribbon-helix-helix protein, CopG family [Bryobacterales bacterium]
MTKTISARLPLKMISSIEEVAAERKRKRGDIVRDALEIYLDTWADYQIAMERLKDAQDEILSEKEFLGELGWDI